MNNPVNPIRGLVNSYLTGWGPTIGATVGGTAAGMFAGARWGNRDKSSAHRATYGAMFGGFYPAFGGSAAQSGHGFMARLGLGMGVTAAGSLVGAGVAMAARRFMR